MNDHKEVFVSSTKCMDSEGPQVSSLFRRTMNRNLSSAAEQLQSLLFHHSSYLFIFLLRQSFTMSLCPRTHYIHTVLAANWSLGVRSLCTICPGLVSCLFSTRANKTSYRFVFPLLARLYNLEKFQVSEKGS